MRRPLLALWLLALIANADSANACQLPMDHPSFLFGRIVKAWSETSKHPLVGRVYDTSKVEPDLQKSQYKAFCLFADDFWIMADKPDILILGEIHDNPEHHRIRASLFQLGALVTEHLSSERGPDFERFKQMVKSTERTLTLDDFKAWTSWASTGWTDDVARMLFEVTVQGKVPVYPGDVARDAIRRVSMEGGAAFPPNELARLKLDMPLGAPLDAASITEIEEAHCGAMPREAFNGMAYAQRYRDANLADVVLKATEKHGSAVLIAGNTHARSDRGVPWYIKQRAPDKRVVSVMLVEVEDGVANPETYVPRDPDGKPATDYIIFTPRAEREDPCEAMRAKMKN